MPRPSDFGSPVSYWSAPSLPGAVGWFSLERQNALLGEAHRARLNARPITPLRARIARALHGLARRLEDGVPAANRQRLPGW